MQNRSGRTAPLLVIAILVVFYPTSAFAYIDPGSGALLLQIVMSGIFGALFLARNFLAKTAVMARRLFSGSGTEATTKSPDEPAA